jgi:hypothetical protein
MGMTCDVDGCDATVEFRVYATYNADQGENVHPLHARYPGAMWRSCSEHLGALALRDDAGPLSTRQWLIIKVSS